MIDDCDIDFDRDLESDSPVDEDVAAYRSTDRVAPLVFEALDMEETNIERETWIIETTRGNLASLLNYAHQLGAKIVKE